MYNIHVESIIEAIDFKKNLQEKLGNITAERDYFEKVQSWQDLNKDPQYRSKKDLTHK